MCPSACIAVRIEEVGIARAADLSEGVSPLHGEFHSKVLSHEGTRHQISWHFIQPIPVDAGVLFPVVAEKLLVAVTVQVDEGHRVGPTYSFAVSCKVDVVVINDP